MMGGWPGIPGVEATTGSEQNTISVSMGLPWESFSAAHFPTSQSLKSRPACRVPGSVARRRSAMSG